MTNKGKPCRIKVSNEGDKCPHHYVEDVVEDEHNHHSDDENNSAHSASRSRTTRSHTENISNVSNVSSEVLSGLIDKITKLEADLQKAKAAPRPTVVSRPQVAKASSSKVVPTGTKKRNMTPAGANRSARWIFYNEHKTDADILASVRGGLIKGNMLVKKATVISGVVVEKEVIPYTLVKVATDMKFDKLTAEEQESYILEAYERNEAKYAE